MNKDSKQKISIVIFNTIIFAAILFVFYYINFIDFYTVRTVYMPILGVCIIAILLNYALFGQVFIISSLLGLFAEYTMSVKQGIDVTAQGQYLNNAILMIGFVVGFIIQMYIYKKGPK